MANYAKIKDGVCTNAAVFDDEEIAVDFGYPVPLPDGYGIGDLYDGESWSHASMPDPEPEPEPEPDVWDKLAAAIREGVNEV